MQWGRIVRVLVAAILAVPPVAGALAAQEDDPLAALVEAWMASPHGDYRSPSFTHWNEDGEVPVECAACHSQPGFVDFLGADKSTPGKVDRPASINAPIGCASCHNAAARVLSSVRFPSGVRVEGLGDSAVCTVCHQGRLSGDAVAAATQALDADTVSADLSFMNIHYGVAAAVLHGGQVRGGYQYPGRTYVGRFQHVPSANTCAGCHDPHTTRVAIDGCLSCHRGVADVRDIRTRHADFDGDGNTAEGIHSEILGLHERLYGAMQAYASEVAGTPIGYAPDSFPYFFADSDGDGEISPDEAVFPNRYRRWTPRLLQAAYNFQMAAKDRGGFVHNPAYLLQLLHDSLQSLGERVEVNAADLQRP
ncbi:polyheme membrane-associated cytochrome C [Nitratireductor sp. ZSWI3]|uniref:polyheme membrane-associated cytochrome C n=1 Tax=Nitratireductor sp. ZSWI3 TaxID=2966359 RepID=UPI00214FDB44|nr:polyheme membrane-associated cytochrome C [Nitratireductor sp. ZSWI3]MCR4269241.1 polyheme membrane-associated cytochrome C [Nitratireductor sp. ZSWI3]